MLQQPSSQPENSIDDVQQASIHDVFDLELGRILIIRVDFASRNTVLDDFASRNA
jgi:hypothetical protein